MPKMELEFRRKFDFFGEIARKPGQIRDGSIREWIHKREQRDGARDGEYWGQFLDFSRVLAPRHPLLKGRRSHEAEAIVDTIRKRKSFKKNVLAGAIAHHFNMQLRQTFIGSRVKRMQKMVGYLYENRQKIRKDALNDFAVEWNKGKPKAKRVGYETLKGDLIALSYAFLPVGNKETVPEQVVASRRGDFMRALALKHRGELDYGKTRRVCEAFTEHSIESDLARLDRDIKLLGKIGTPEHEREIKKTQKNFSDVLRELYELRKSEPGVHAATAGSTAWLEVGWPLHSVVPGVNHLVYAMFDLAERKQQGEAVRLEDYELPFDAARKDALEHMKKVYKIVPREEGESRDDYEARKVEKAGEEMLKAWFTHMHHAWAKLSYEKARHSLKGKREYHGQTTWGHPTKFEVPTGKAKAKLKHEKKGKEAEAGRHLSDADGWWNVYKTLVRKNPFLAKK
ncbi:MAG: hypothetical protein KAW41_05605 [Candidatus Diapherotrites archaeon]|nr:hypothetical protein [Candidatus Diapherotrites archaeon]